MFIWPIIIKIKYSLSESVTQVPSHANRIQKKSDSSDGLSSVYLQAIMNGLGRAGSFCPASSLMTQQNKLSHNCPLQEPFHLSCVCFYPVCCVLITCLGV